MRPKAKPFLRSAAMFRRARGPHSHARVGAHAAGAQDGTHAECILSPGAQEGVRAQRQPASCPDPTCAHTPVRALQGRDPPAASF